MVPSCNYYNESPRSLETWAEMYRVWKEVWVRYRKIFCTPSDNPLLLLEQEGISDLGFEEKYSRNLNCISAFLSHYSLWKKCIELDEEVIIFEHDAVLVDPIPNAPYTYVCNFVTELFLKIGLHQKH